MKTFIYISEEEGMDNEVLIIHADTRRDALLKWFEHYDFYHTVDATEDELADLVVNGGDEAEYVQFIQLQQAPHWARGT